MQINNIRNKIKASLVINTLTRTSQIYYIDVI